eukprot:Seg1069.2 transcript_id=Seg1069.2/GoldUCD/mRNA.D3Y31 product="hypothetical protein" protein_id=Seg1069.2/GoldUCD/D3Y31
MEYKEIYQKTQIVQSLETKVTKPDKQESIVWYKGPQDDDFFEKILLHSGCFEAVGKLPGNDNWLVQQHNSEVLIMFDCRDNERGCILKKDREKFKAELDRNKHDCAVLVSLSANVDPKGESFVIKTSSKGKPFLYISNLRSFTQPEIICKIASLALIHAVENKPTDQNLSVRKFLTSQLSTLKDLLQTSQELRKLADKNEAHVKEICNAFELLQGELAEKDSMSLSVPKKVNAEKSADVSLAEVQREVKEKKVETQTKFVSKKLKSVSGGEYLSELREEEREEQTCSYYEGLQREAAEKDSISVAPPQKKHRKSESVSSVQKKQVVKKVKLLDVSEYFS